MSLRLQLAKDRIVPRRDSNEDQSKLCVPSKRKEATEDDDGETMESDHKYARAMEGESSPSESGSEPDHPLDSLLNRLLVSLTPSKFERTENNKFFPREIFDDILSDAAEGQGSRQNQAGTVLQLMGIGSTRPSKADNELADYILDRAKKFFLITIWIRLEKLYVAMKLFKEHNFSDEMLPLEEWSGDDLSSGSVAHPFVIMENDRKCGKRAKGTKGKPKRIWDAHYIGQFQEDQWKFLAPTFSTSDQNRDFDPRCPIPFVEKNTNQGRGAHGIVYKYTIHPAHHKDLLFPISSEPCVVAVKAFRKDAENVAAAVKKEVDALEMMNALGKDHIVRFLTSFRRGTPDDLEYFLLFEWAHGGNLDDFWKQEPALPRTAAMIRWLIEQLYGLAEALAAAHGATCRHGDLKPANILWFREAASAFGTLKIGDWGEAKIHKEVTSLRHGFTTAGYGTRRYEPPETGSHSPKLGQGLPKRSRLYDIWGFGCIIFECIIWCLYDSEQLKRFNRSNLGTYGTSEFFYERDHTTGRAKVHGVVEHWMKHMANDKLCRSGETALGDLLQIVRTGLLVVELPQEGGSIYLADGGSSNISARFSDLGRPSNAYDVRPTIEITAPVSSELADADANSNAHGSIPSFNFGEPLPMEPTEIQGPEPKQQIRFRAHEVKKGLRQILHSQRGDPYWSRFQNSRPPPVGSDRSSRFLVPSGPHLSTSTNLRTPTTPTTDYEHPALNPEDWNFELDNPFAARVLSRSANLTGTPVHHSMSTSKLCANCEHFGERLRDSRFSISYATQTLRRNAAAGSCHLCSLLWQAYCENAPSESKEVQFYRANSTLHMSGTNRPVLTLLRNNGPDSRAHGIQIGYHKLPDVGSDLHFGLIQEWLNDCDSTHVECKASTRTKQTRSADVRLPTRLICVGNDEDEFVRLQETRSGDEGHWIALSYRWGDSPPFSTTRQNLSSHIEGMKLTTLPRTFQDAIRVTRGLRQKYLWIDSICIVQGKDGDFSDESKRMEDVYSGAYCVLAASCATDQRSGFLLPRVRRHTVALNSKSGGGSDSGTIYVCSMIEDFRGHVLQGALHKRGWVLQEHALARRTVFFTEHQTYWECGYGVRCETMVRMTNESAALLGDPEFPRILDPAKHGERILRFQELYQQYSRLNLSSDYDRPTAIDGLQRRLLRTMGVNGGFGVLDNTGNRGLLRRSLLWRRGEGIKTLTPITFPSHRERVPSWSWMSVSGGIDYFPPTWRGYDWQDIQSPWSYSTLPKIDNAFIGRSQPFECSKWKQNEYSIVFDDPTIGELPELMAIVLGVEKSNQTTEEKKHYVLIARPKVTSVQDSVILYERVGAGYMPGKCLEGVSKTCILV